MAKHFNRGSSLKKKDKRRGPVPGGHSAWGGAVFVFLLTILTVRLLGDNLYDYPPNPDHQTLPPNSVIVCLAGGKHRIETAYSLFAEGVGENLWIIGAGKKSTVMTLARLQAVDVAQKIPWDRFDKIQVETESRNTLENAFAVKRFLEQNPRVKNLILVTSSYHMRRAKLMIEQHISHEVNIIPFTPLNTEVEPENWWHTWIGIWLTIAEYVKFLLATILLPSLGYF